MKRGDDDNLWKFSKLNGTKLTLEKVQSNSNLRPKIQVKAPCRTVSSAKIPKWDIKDKSMVKVLKTLGEIQNNIQNTKEKLKVKTKSPSGSKSEDNGGMKKYKSWDQIRKPIFGPSLTQRVTDVLDQVRKKPLSELNLFHGSSALTKKSLEYDSIFPKNTYRENACEPERNFQNFSSLKPAAAEKSQSYDFLKYPPLTRVPNKCVSFEDGTNRKPEKPYDEYRLLPGLSSERIIDDLSLIEQPLLSYLPPKFNYRSHYTNCPMENGIPETRSSTKLFSEPKETVNICPCPDQEANDILQNCNLEYFNDFKSSNPDPARKYNNLTWQDSLPEKKISRNPKICNCLHIHKENSIKKICIHKCTASKETVSQVFRLNSTSDKINTEENKFLEKEDITTTPVIKPPETGSNPRPIAKTNGTKPLVKTPVKTKPKIKKKESVKQDPKIMLWRNGNQIQILGQHKKKDSKCLEKSGKPTPLKSSKTTAPTTKSVKSEENNREKALEELEVLEKLFSKLNTLERLARKRRGISEPNLLENSAGKKFKGCTKFSSVDRKKVETTKPVIKPDKEAELQTRLEKLRSSILVHVQNWIKLDFDDKNATR